MNLLDTWKNSLHWRSAK